MLTWTFCAIATATYADAPRTRVSVMPSEGHLFQVNLKDGAGLRGVRSSG
jgi:hypothetical protein